MTRRPWASFAIIIAALLLVAVAAHGTGVQWREADFNIDQAQDMIEPEPLSEDFELPELPSEFEAAQNEAEPLPSWISWLLLAVLVGLPLAFLAALLLRRLTWWLVDTRRLPAPDDLRDDHRSQDVALVEHALAESLAEIDLGTRQVVRKSRFAAAEAGAPPSSTSCAPWRSSWCSSSWSGRSSSKRSRSPPPPWREPFWWGISFW
jgi:hypothetical protein